MSKGETMEELMNQELNEAIATLNRANGALSRIFGIEEEGVRCNMCMTTYEADVTICSKCLTSDYLMDIGG
jgi:hypothetical protein